jgi:micrococcal nuclease
MLKRIVVFVFLVVFCSCSQDYSQVRVLEAIDGDTIKLSNGKLLRYIGLDTPEVRLKKGAEFIYSPQPFALEAKEYNRKLVEGKLVRIEFDLEKQDQYGRLLGYCFVDDVMINAKLIEEGYAVIYTRPPNVKYAELFISLQSQARQQNKGLWGSYKVIDQAQAGSYINQIRTVRGKVLNAFKSAKCIFLNFGSNYKTDFTVVIFNNSLKSFYDKGIDPLTFYKDKVVEVSGRIKEYNGPEIIVNSPFEIEVVE